MLQELLNLGLVDIGSDDSRLEKMQAAASALAQRFGAEPHLLIPATLVALDEDVDEDDPFFILVEEIVTAEWKTLRNTHSNRPRQLLRSIAIDALATASADSVEVSSIIWNTAASLMRHQQMRLGKAAGLIEQFLGQACERAEGEAVKRAGMSFPRSKRKVKKSISGVAALNLIAKIEAKEIIADVEGAAGPANAQGQNLPNTPNPHWSSSGGNWSYEFAPRMTAALVKAVNLGTSRLTESIAKDLTAHMASLEKQLIDELNAAELLQAETEQSAASGRMRLDVLWWSEARYSPLLKRGYRELTSPIVALVAAIDLAAITTPLAPASVSYVLAEMVAGICRGAEPSPSSQPLKEYLKSLKEALLDLRDVTPLTTTNEGRVPLAELVFEAAAGTSLTTNLIQARAGIDPDLQLTPAEFAMWIFREIQAHRMLKELA